MLKLNKKIIPRSTVNSGYTFEEAIFEGIDNALDVTEKEYSIDCYMYKIKSGVSYAVCDTAGGANVKDVFTTKQEHPYYEAYQSIEEMNRKIGLFGGGSFSHLNVSKSVWFFTKKNNKWQAVHLKKNIITGDFEREDIDNVLPMESLPEEFIRKCNSDFNNYSTVIYAENVKLASNQKVKEFISNEDTFEKGVIGSEFIKNLRCTYEMKFNEGYEITFNGRSLKPLDICYRDDVKTKHIETLTLSLKELFEVGEQHKEDVYAKFMPLYQIVYGDDAEEYLLKEQLVIECYALDTSYINNKQYWCSDDKVTCNPESSGFWLFRNGRRIDNPLPILPQKLTHPSYNGFRAKVMFSPVFDEFFGIQTNKNKATISNEIKNAVARLFDTYEDDNGIDILDVSKGYRATSDSEQEDLFVIDEVRVSKSKLKGLKDWKKAEVIVADYFRIKEYDIKVMTDKRTGYDIYVKNEEENGKYVEVKLIKNGEDTFTLTDNEYILANQQKENYVVCLVEIKKKHAIVKLLQNPIAKVTFKEVKSWKSNSKINVIEDKVILED